MRVVRDTSNKDVVANLASVGDPTNCPSDCMLANVANREMAQPGQSETSAAGFCLWFRQTARHRWAIVGRGTTLAKVVDLIGCGDRHGGDWMPLVTGKHPDVCGAPDRPRRRPRPTTSVGTA